MFSDDEFDGFLNPGQLLSGLPTKRARTLLFLIENRTARLATNSWQVIDESLSDASAREHDLRLLDDFIPGHEKASGPTIQDLERYAFQWAEQVPDNVRIQAALAQLLGQKYRFTPSSIPNIRAVLSLDDEAVQSAYRTLYDQPLGNIYAQRLTPLDGLRWQFAGIGHWLESVPPFWMACILTVTLNTSSAVLAFPTAVASVGPLIGIGLIILFGICNTLTVLCTIEAITRSSSMHFGKPFIGRLIADYLGSAGTFLFSLSLGVGSFLALLSVYIGISTTLADFTGWSPELWAALVFLIGVVILARGALNLPVGLMLLLGTAQIVLLLILACVALTHIHPQYLFSMPLFVSSHSFDLTRFGAFGVIYLAYTAQHKLITQLARSVLPRDPGARSLIGGTVVGTAFMILIFCIWVIGTSADFPASRLATYSGTVLSLLSQQNGPIVGILGCFLLIISLGVGSLRESSAVSQLVRELLPRRPFLILPRRKGRLVFESHWKSGGPIASLTYLGIEANGPCFRWDIQAGETTFREEITITDTWETSALFAELPVLRRINFKVSLKVQEANQEQVHLRLQTRLLPIYIGEWDSLGLSMSGLLSLQNPDIDVINMILREGEVSASQVALWSKSTEEIALTRLQNLMEQGQIRQIERGGTTYYQARMAPKQGGRLSNDIWQALDDKSRPFELNQSSPHQRRMKAIVRWFYDIILSDPGRFLLSMSPVLCIFLFTESLLLSGAQSFSRPFSISGVVTGPIFAGIIPILMLVASRRKGDSLPATIYRFLGHPAFTIGLFAVFLIYLLLHGLAIWINPVERLVALSATVLAASTSFLVIRRGAFIPRMVVELREEIDSPDSERREWQLDGADVSAAFPYVSCSIIAEGRPVLGAVQLGYADNEVQFETQKNGITGSSTLWYAIFSLPATSAKELKIWVHRVTHEQESEAIPAVVEIMTGSKISVYDLNLFNGELVIPVSGESCQLKMTLSASAAVTH